MPNDDISDDQERKKLKWWKRWKRPSEWGPTPPWTDWVHKLGPLIGIFGGVIIFTLTWLFTVAPVYKRALLEERNAELEVTLKTNLKAINEQEIRIKDMAVALSQKEAVAQTLQNEIAKKEKEVDGLASELVRQQTALEASQTSAEELRIELARSKAELFSIRDSLLQANSAADKAFNVLRVKTITIFENLVLNACLIPAVNPYWLPLPLAADKPSYKFSSHGRCFASVLGELDTLEGLPERERRQFSELVARLDERRTMKLLSLDQELRRIGAERDRVFREAMRVQSRIAIRDPLPGEDTDGIHREVRKEIDRSLDMQRDAMKIVEDAWPKLFEQYKAFIVNDLKALKLEFLTQQTKP